VFPLIGKCFPLINFFNGKQTQESLKSDFLKRNMDIVYVWFLNTVVLDCLHGALLSEWVG